MIDFNYLLKLGELGIAFLALYALIVLLSKKNSFVKLEKKVNNEMEHRLNSIEKRIELLEKELIRVKEEVGYLRGKVNSFNSKGRLNSKNYE